MLLRECYNEIISFAKDCRQVFIYGAGLYGCYMDQLLTINGYGADGFIVSNKGNFDSGDVKLLEFKEAIEILGDDDGVIFALSEKNQKTMDWDTIDKCNFKKLILKDYQLYEVQRCNENYRDYDNQMNREINEDYCQKIKEQERVLLDENKMNRKELQEKYHFEDWHVNNGNSYGEDLACTIAETLRDKKGISTVFEVGCGLCSILGNDHLCGCKRVGIDLSDGVLNADKEVYGQEISFRKGSFEVIQNETIDALITVNFIHSISDEQLEQIFEKLFADNTIGYYVADEVTGRYPYSHKFEKLLPDSFSMEKKLGPYPSDGGFRYIKIWKNTKVN